jgi:hypothetical protein
MRKHDSKNAATPGTGPGCQQKHSATCKPKGSKTKLPYQEIQRLHEQGLTGVEIAKQLGLSDNSVYRVLRKLGLGAACHKHKREVLADGKVLCYICEERKDVSEFNHGYAYCRPCGYAKMAMRSNENLNKAIHFRNVHFRSRAKRLNIYYELTDEQLVEHYVTQGGRCAYCHKPMVIKLGIGRSGNSASIERMIPDTLGGTYTGQNVLWVHFNCNARRWALTGERLKARYPEASRAIEQVALARQLELPFPLDSQITVTNDPEPQPATS